MDCLQILLVGFVEFLQTVDLASNLATRCLPDSFDRLDRCPDLLNLLVDDELEATLQFFVTYLPSSVEIVQLLYLRLVCRRELRLEDHATRDSQHSDTHPVSHGLSLRTRTKSVRLIDEKF